VFDEKFVQEWPDSQEGARRDGMVLDSTDCLAIIRRILQEQGQLELGILVGSRASGSATPASDWDIALSWQPGLDWMAILAHTEDLRRRIAQAIGVAEQAVDLIDLARANLAMRAGVAEEGLPLKGEETLAWSRFLLRTWRELEDFYWERRHAA
jgi:predicted nucleotidyltransferase